MDGRFQPIPKAYCRYVQFAVTFPTVKDRIVQAAVKLVIEPIFEFQFLETSYGFRPGRGCKDALREVDGLLKAGHTHVVDADLKGYFDSIPHCPLMERVESSISGGVTTRPDTGLVGACLLNGLERWTPTRRHSARFSDQPLAG